MIRQRGSLKNLCFLNELFDLLEQPSISANPKYKDAVLKTLSSLKKQGVKISINEIAQILSNLGLQVHKTSILTKDATRLKIPTVISWGESFAIVSKSNKEGITVISPREGKIQIKKELIGLKLENNIQCLINI